MTAYRQTPPGYVWVTVPAIPAHFRFVWLDVLPFDKHARPKAALPNYPTFAQVCIEAWRIMPLVILWTLASGLQVVSCWTRYWRQMLLARWMHDTGLHLLARAGDVRLVEVKQLGLFELERAG